MKYQIRKFSLAIFCFLPFVWLGGFFGFFASGRHPWGLLLSVAYYPVYILQLLVLIFILTKVKRDLNQYIFYNLLVLAILAFLVNLINFLSIGFLYGLPYFNFFGSLFPIGSRYTFYLQQLLFASSLFFVVIFIPSYFVLLQVLRKKIKN